MLLYGSLPSPYSNVVDKVQSTPLPCLFRIAVSSSGPHWRRAVRLLVAGLPARSARTSPKIFCAWVIPVHPGEKQKRTSLQRDVLQHTLARLADLLRRSCFRLHGFLQGPYPPLQPEPGRFIFRYNFLELFPNLPGILIMG
jgi:hypothetical protein